MKCILHSQQELLEMICEQMSAWYVLSSIGLFDANPGDPYYIIQTPIFKDVTINLENGNHLNC